MREALQQSSMTSELEPQVTLPWLIKLRWLALVGQLVALALGRAFDFGFEWHALAAVGAVTLVSNLVLVKAAARAVHAGSRVIGGVLVLDMLLLTGLLAASGGAMNPFTVLYVVHITLSAVALSDAWTIGLASVAVLGFGLLFALPQDPHALHHASSLERHLRGMWVAFLLASGFTAFFVRRVTQAIRAQREEITALRVASARNARLASLTTLAAGAAHELGTPLGTIAVAAHEALAAAERLPNAAAVAEDLRLIELETERCRDILGQLTTHARERSDAPLDVRAEEVVQSLRSHLARETLERVEVVEEAPELRLQAPAGALAQSIAALVQNAMEASAGDERVTVRVAAGGAYVSISIEDRGAGIPPEVLGRVGEPFFTTKQPGRGLGLGVFLARAFAESHGGVLAFEARAGGGTRAVLKLPVANVGTA